MLKRFISYYRPHRLLLYSDLLAALLASLIGILYPITTRRMLTDYIPNRLYSSIITAGIFLLALYIVRMLLNYFMQFYGHVMGVRMQQHMRRDMFDHLESLSYSYYDDHETGEIMSRITTDLMDISELAHHGPENVIISFITVVISFVYLMGINLPLTLIIFACVPLLLILSTLLRKKQVSAFRECRRTLAEINASIESSVSGIRVTKAYCNAQKEKEKFEVGNSRFAAARYKAYKAMGQFHAGTTFITDIFNVVVLIAGGLFGWSIALYSIIYQFCSTQVIQFMYKRYQKMTLFIISDKSEEIYHAIKNTTNHDATLFKGIGCYEEKERTLIYSVINSEAKRGLITLIRSIDKHAFINVVKTEELDGRFNDIPHD